MALSPSFTVCIIDQQPGTVGTTMNAIRAWLDHTKIQPQLFQAAASGVGFEITFVHGSRTSGCMAVIIAT